MLRLFRASAAGNAGSVPVLYALFAAAMAVAVMAAGNVVGKKMNAAIRVTTLVQ
jgi:hypothetical protein